MGESGRIFRGKTHAVQKALGIVAKKGRLTVEEMTLLIEGGNVCARHGLDLVAEGREGSGTGRVLSALLTTADVLLGKVMDQLKETEDIPAGADSLTRKAGRVMMETMFLAQWVNHMKNAPAHRGRACNA